MSVDLGWTVVVVRMRIRDMTQQRPPTLETYVHHKLLIVYPTFPDYTLLTEISPLLTLTQERNVVLDLSPPNESGVSPDHKPHDPPD